MKAKKYLTAKEAADELGVTPWTIYRWVKAGLLQAIQHRAHGPLKFTREGIARFIEQSSTC